MIGFARVGIIEFAGASTIHIVSAGEIGQQSTSARTGAMGIAGVGAINLAIVVIVVIVSVVIAASAGACWFS